MQSFLQAVHLGKTRYNDSNTISYIDSHGRVEENRDLL